MTKEEFLNSTINLQELYNKKLNDTQLEFWFDELKGFEIEKYRRAIGEFAKFQKTFPALSEVLARIRNLREPQEIKPIEFKKVNCKSCHGSGLVKYIKKENGIDYDFYCTCDCENGTRLELPMLRKFQDVFYYRGIQKKEEQKVTVSSIDYDVSQINFG